VAEDVFSGVNPVRLNPDVIDSDVGSFISALERGDAANAVTEFRGPFLDGFYLGDSPELEQWVEGARARIADGYAEALERVADSAEDAGDYRVAARSWRTLIDADPMSTRNAVGLVRVLIHAGENAAAVQHAEHHENLVARELGTTAGPVLAELLNDLRGSSTPPAVTTNASVVHQSSVPTVARLRTDQRLRYIDQTGTRRLPHASTRRLLAWYAAVAVLAIGVIAIAFVLGVVWAGR
jgi:DNA-binding SARP family transcriptional activator